MTWGVPKYGADSSAVQQLRSVQKIESSVYAFAAILSDGGVVTWGDPTYGPTSDQEGQTGSGRWVRLCCHSAGWVVY